MSDIDPLYLEVDELDFRLGLTELLTANGRLTKETNQLIAKTITDTKVLAMKEVLAQYIQTGLGMSQEELIAEQHNSKRLGEFLGSVGYERPNCGNLRVFKILCQPVTSQYERLAAPRSESITETVSDSNFALGASSAPTFSKYRHTAA